MSELPLPAFYFPPASGKYEVIPGLKPFGASMGNGAVDAQVFQLDREFARYRQEKLAARAESLDRYWLKQNPSPAAWSTVLAFIIDRLVEEHPAEFILAKDELFCKLTGERLNFDRATGELLPSIRPASGPPYASALDALASQIQEDLALMERRGDDYVLTALHLCLPSHWAGEDKIGRGFNAVHEPVAHFEGIARTAPALLQGLVQRGPFVRFAWSLTADNKLNHHPAHSSGGRNFAALADASELFFRVERQVTWGFPAVDAFLFAIRVYTYSCSTFRDEQRRQLRSALDSMSPASRDYKSLTRDFDVIQNLLR